jgi:hypothetical protein
MSDLPPPSPEGQLIRRVRELAIPKLTIRAAAARVGMSPEQWGNVERGFVRTRGAPPRPFRPPAATLARMSTAIGLSPERLEEEGQRPDAAQMLREILPPRARPGGGQGAGSAPGLADHISAVWAEIRSAASRYGTPRPSGSQAFPGSRWAARLWDDDEGPLGDDEGRVEAIAAIRMVADRHERGRTGGEAGRAGLRRAHFVRR